MKWIDLPPVWLAGFLAAVWALGQSGAAGPGLGAWAAPAGVALIVAGAVLMFLAVIEMSRHKTTVIPHREADSLVTTGIFRLSRNPIYLGDALVLAGAIVLVGPILSIVLVPVFMWIILHRFIAPEEARLSRRFGADFDRYCQEVRRWI